MGTAAAAAATVVMGGLRQYASPYRDEGPERKPGFYWVSYKKNLVVAKFDGYYSWYIPGKFFKVPEYNLDKIYEQPIVF